MKFLSLAVLMIGLTSSALAVTGYKNSKATLALGFTSKEMCSCLFASGRSEKDCRDYVDVAEIHPRISIDHKRQKVTASLYLILWQTAYYEGPQKGCRIH